MAARAPGWPATLTADRVTLRPLRLRDGRVWTEVRRANVQWLKPWEATPVDGPVGVPTSYAVFATMTRRQRRQARRGAGMPFALLYDDRLVGQLNVGSIVRGSLHGCHLGYWIDSRVAGLGIMPTAVALVTDHCFWAVGLHRVEVNIRPENVASRRVVEKLGFREEGVRQRFLHIDGEWRDHISYALVRDDVPGGLLARWQQSRKPQDGGLAR
jgi:[ribosomal protein S5]-alanine N-acetyltransferase